MEKSRKQEILDAAAHLFRKQGYQGSSLKAIAQAVGMEAAPSLYNHIKSKQSILSELLLGIAGAFQHGMQAVMTSSLDPRGKLEQLIRLHVTLTVAQPDAIALVISEWSHLEGEDQGAFLRLRDAYERDFRQVLRDGVAQGQFKPLDVELTMFTLLSTLRALYAWYAKYQQYNPIELENQLIGALLLGVVQET
jgi:AcrR family transcriptional regulator